MNKIDKLINVIAIAFLMIFASLFLLGDRQEALSQTKNNFDIAQSLTSRIVKKIQNETIGFQGEIIANEDVSAIAIFGNYLLIGSDEGNQIQVLKKLSDESTYQVVRNITLPVPAGSKQEADIEGITITNNTVYVVGSHSLNRKTIKSDLTYQENLKRMVKVEDELNRKGVYRLEFDPNTAQLSSEIQRESLSNIIKNEKNLERFITIPSKENGIDIEGIAVKEDKLYLGFRSPILRDNYVPVLIVKFEDLKKEDYYQISYVNLNGNGIRDLTAVEKGFLILSGSGGDGISPYQLYFWDGKDSIPGTDKEPTTLKLLGEIPAPEGAKAEGMTVMKETDSAYKILVVYDGIANGHPTFFEVSKYQ
jgi:hypothetical protein